MGAKKLEIEPKLEIQYDLSELDLNVSAIETLKNNPRWKLWKEEADNGMFAVSFSKCNRMRKCPLEMVHGICDEKKPTRAMKFGTLIHTSVLEPDKIKGKYLVMPYDTNRASNINLKNGVIGKSHFEAYVNLASSRGIEKENVIDKSDYLEAVLVRELIHSEPKCATVIKRAIAFEQEFYFNYWYKGKLFRFRGFKDALLDNNAGLDLKNMTYEKLKRHDRVLEWECYFMQAVIYLLDNHLKDKSNPDNQIKGAEQYKRIADKIIMEGEFYFICSDGKGVKPALRVSPQGLALGLNQLHETLDKFIKCQFFDSWFESYPISESVSQYFTED